MGDIGSLNGVEFREDDYSVQEETRNVFHNQILGHPWVRQYIPPEALEYASHITFVGDPAPSIPVNWRFSESSGALHAFEASLVAALIRRKYNVSVSDTVINTDHAQLAITSCYLWTINPDSDKPISASVNPELLNGIIPNYNFHRRDATLYRKMVTSIYKTADGRFFNLHANLNPDRTLDMLGLPHEMDAKDADEAAAPFIAKISQMTSTELQHLCADVYKHAGVVCESAETFRQTEHGKANAHVTLFEIHDRANSAQHPCWWPNSPQTSPRRPLAGLKVVDISRVIAAPAISRGLAELGASVMRVSSNRLPDISSLHLDLNHGKWSSTIDLDSEHDRQVLQELIWDADVVVSGYRPGSLDKYGFGPEDIIEMLKDRPRGVISVREDCYGWYGPWRGRPGWQQISDSCTGVSEGFGRAMGLTGGESVTPLFPNSDYMTGLAGTCGVLAALMRRAEKGGSYLVDLALNYYNSWLVDCVGEYPQKVWEKLWNKHDKIVYRSYNNPSYTVRRTLATMRKLGEQSQFNNDFFEEVDNKAMKFRMRMLKPVIQFQDKDVELGYHIGTRGNGLDAPRWPEDLLTQVVV